MEEPRAPSSSADGKRPRKTPLDFALTRLGGRGHSRGELEAKMARAGYPAGEIASTLAYLDERRYLDDAAFARDFARAHSERKHWGPGRIEQRLRELHVAAADIAAALAEVFPAGEEEAARRALERLLARRSKDAGRRARARAYRHLLSRGFAPDVVHRLVSRQKFGDTDAYE